MGTFRRLQHLLQQPARVLAAQHLGNPRDYAQGVHGALLVIAEWSLWLGQSWGTRLAWLLLAGLG